MSLIDPTPRTHGHSPGRLPLDAQGDQGWGNATGVSPAPRGAMGALDAAGQFRDSDAVCFEPST